jgi:hypothetical protein
VVDFNFVHAEKNAVLEKRKSKNAGQESLAHH